MRPYNLSRHLKTFVAIGILLFVGSAHAANWFARPSSQGSNNGTDWNNAWSLSSINWSNVKPGDTIWLAGGTYTSSLVVKASGTASAPISIMRVTSSDKAATRSPGWSSSFDSQVVISGQSPCIDIPNSSYITIDGHQNSGSLANNTRVYGIKCTIPSGGGDAVYWGSNNFSGVTVSVTNVSFKNIELLGPYNTVSRPGTSAANGFNLAPYDSPRNNLLIHDCRVRGFCESIRENKWANAIIEYCYLADTANDGRDHEDVDLTYPGTNETWRYNVITNSPNDGIMTDPGGYGTWSFYGNVYWNSYATLVMLRGPRGKFVVYNNVFGSGPNGPFNNTPSGWVKLETPSQGGTATAGAGSQVYNNIFFYVENNLVSGDSNVASDYNAYFQYAQHKGVNGEAHGVSLTTNPFVNSAAGDFHLTAAANAILARGIPISPNGFYEKDLDGNTRGANGSWYIGAYQYGSAAAQPSPMSPSSLRITATGG
jgi:hypothetical protein